LVLTAQPRLKPVAVFAQVVQQPSQASLICPQGISRKLAGKPADARQMIAQPVADSRLVRTVRAVIIFLHRASPSKVISSPRSQIARANFDGTFPVSIPASDRE
jgi:hypothetical protein